MSQINLADASPVQGRPWSVTIYCGRRHASWGPRSLWEGIGGSEEAVILLSRHLARQGCSVEVYTDPLDPAPSADGVRWASCESFDKRRGGDVFIAWRDPRLVELAGQYAQRYHWMHDRPIYGYPHDYADRFDRVLAVSRHHAAADGFKPVKPERMHLTSNALDEEFLSPAGDNEPHRAIYASCPARGLMVVLEAWPAIRREVPDATLDVFYGFTADYDDMARAYPGLAWVKGRVLSMVQQDGVTFHGMVGQDRLAQFFARAGVWLYPTDTLETSCITAMKALAMGCIPITSGIGVLAETLGGRDCGPVHPTGPISRSRWRRWRFRRRVVDIMRRGDSPRIKALRHDWSRWARARYSWSDVARDWRRLFAEVEREKKDGPSTSHPT